MQTVALTTREHSTEFALVSARKVESGDISTSVDVTSSHADRLVTLCHHIIHRFVGVDILMLLIDIGQFHCLAHLEGATIHLLQSHDETEERRLSCTVGSDDPHDTIGRKHEVEVVEEHLLTESLFHVLCLYHLIAQSRTVGDEDFQLLLPRLLLLVEHLFVGVETRLSFSLSCFGSHTHPFELTLQCLTTFRGLFLLLLHAFCLLVEP